MVELRESREAANTIREAVRDYGKEINKDIVAAKILSQIPVARICLSDSSNYFSPLQTLMFIVPFGFWKISIELELENLSSFDACRLSRILFILNQNIHPVPKNINPGEL